MSYTPTIIIQKEDLDKAIKDGFINGNPPLDEAEEYLVYIHDNNDVAYLKNTPLLIFEPEFSSLNTNVRQLLSELNIEYGISN